MRAWSIVFLTASVWGQSFEVASVKEHVGRMPRIGVSTSGNRLTGEACTLRGLLMFAFDVKNYQIAGDTSNVFYDVEAKSAGESIPSREAFRQMLRALLAERFHLQTHWDEREMQVYALEVAKRGLKLKESATDAEPVHRVHVDGRNYELTIEKGTIADLVETLNNSAFVDRPVVDRTGLSGSYSVRLTYTPGFQKDAPENIDLFAAVQSQLGLRLEPDKGPIRVLVVDRWTPPEGN